jgi:hypothetical protein
MFTFESVLLIADEIFLEKPEETATDKIFDSLEDFDSFPACSRFHNIIDLQTHRK